VNGNPISWTIIEGAAGNLIAFELKTDLVPGGNADAWTLQWDSSIGAYDPPDYSTPPDMSAANGNPVVDMMNCLRARGHDDVVTGQSGATGFCTSNREIVAIKQQAMQIKGTVPTGTSPTVTKTTGTFALSSITVTDDGQSPGSSLTVTNPGFCFDSGVTVYCIWDSSIPGYRVYDGPCAASAPC
jgi:hypothetical protein